MDDGAAAESRAAVEQSSPPEGAGNQTRSRTTQGNLVEEATRVAATLNDKLPTLSQETRLHGERPSAPEATHAPQANEDEETFDSQRAAPSHAQAGGAESAEDTAAAAATTATPAQTDVRGGRMRQRAASVGASVGENLRPRVEKLREASTVVFDEASDDPGLRFVIIAALLFLLFLFILLFSYILG
jgi:hypothetical protein